jgi:membrane-anchored mycosin MYCP
VTRLPGRHGPRLAAAILAALLGAVVTGLPAAAGAAPGWAARSTGGGPTARLLAPACQLAPTQTVKAEPWATQRLAYRSVWPFTRGRGVLVGVVDTGVDAQHPTLAGQVRPGIDVINGGGTADTDCVGHGTFVAGIIASRVIDGVGFSGVAPEAKIFPVRQADATKEGNLLSLAASIRAAVDAGVGVINVSVTGKTPIPQLTDAIQYAADHDVVIVAAAGNDAEAGAAPRYPAAYPGVIAVGAIGTDGKIGSFSQTGTGVSVVAPGVDIVGPGAGGTGLVVGEQGTSFAAPFVTGVVALVRAYRPDLTAAQVKHRIEVTTDRPAARALPDPVYGFGMVNPLRAVTAEIPGESGMPAMVHAGRLPPPPAAAVGGDPVRRRGTGLTAGLLFAAALTFLIAYAVTPRRRSRGPVRGMHPEREPAGGG